MARNMAPGQGFDGRLVVAVGELCATSGYVIELPGLKSVLRGGFRPDSNREYIKIGSPAGLRPAGRLIVRLSRLESGRQPTRKIDARPGSIIA